MPGDRAPGIDRREYPHLNSVDGGLLPDHDDRAVAESDAQAEWLEIARLVSSAIPENVNPEAWLGHLVVASEEAATRAREMARRQARSMVAEARVEGETLRAANRRDLAVRRSAAAPVIPTPGSQAAGRCSSQPTADPG